MKFLLGLIAVVIAAFTMQFVLPIWWCTALICGLIAALIGIAPWKSLIYAFIGVFLVWGGLGYYMDAANEGILSGKMAELFKIDGGLLLILITAFIGGFTGGLGAMTGSLFRQLFQSDGKKRRKRKRR